jgi:hypothetical protein
MTNPPSPPAECLPKEWCPLRAELLMANGKLEFQRDMAQTIARELLAKHRKLIELVPPERVQEFTYAVTPSPETSWLYE